MSDNIFESKSIPKAYFSLALPVVFSMLITIIYNITDTYFIARTQNTSLVAGVSLCAPVFTMLMAFGNIFGQGGSSLISRLMGQKAQERLWHVSSFCFYISIVFGAVSGVFMLIFRTPLLYLLGADSTTYEFALPYFTWMAIGAPFVVLSFIGSNLLRAEGMSKESMISTVGGSVVNIILDPLLIFTFHLGAAGAAIATVLGYVFTDLFCLYITLYKSSVLSVDIRKWTVTKEECSQIFGIGISAALVNLMSSFCMILMNQNLLTYGSDKIAAMGICQKISMIVMLVIVGFSFGGAPLIGYTYGSGNKDRLKQLLGFVLRFLCSIALVLSLILIVLAPVAVHIFLKDEALVQTTVLMLRAQVASMICLAVIQFICIIFQATGKTVPALILSVSRQGFVFVIVLFIAIRAAGYYGIIFTQAVSDLITAVLAFLLYKKYMK